MLLKNKFTEYWHEMDEAIQGLEIGEKTGTLRAVKQLVEPISIQDLFFTSTNSKIFLVKFTKFLPVVNIPTNEILAEFRRKNARSVYIFRDLRDAMTSNIRKKKVESHPEERKKLIKQWSINWVEYYHTWVDLPGILVSKYEQVVSNLYCEVKRISHHLGIYLDDSQYMKIASGFTLSKQKERIEEIKKNLLNEKYNIEGVSFDPHSLLHSNHIHSGEIGGWEKFLTYEEILLIERMTANWLLKNDYKLTVFKGAE